MTDPASLFQLCGCGRVYTAPGRMTACVGCGAKRFWRAQPHLPLVLAVAVHGAGIERSAQLYRMRRPRALRLLQLGLRRYADFC